MLFALGLFCVFLIFTFLSEHSFSWDGSVMGCKDEWSMMWDAVLTFVGSGLSLSSDSVHFFYQVASLSGSLECRQFSSHQ
jgi:hypothetical protein